MATKKEMAGPEICSWHDKEIVAKISEILRSGRAFAGTTDTVFGLFAPATKHGKVLLDEIKKREEKPYIILIRSKDDLNFFTKIDGKIQIEKIIDNCWPGPVTLVLKAREDAPDFIRSAIGTIAIRIPNHPAILNLLAQTGPLFSTSANLAGSPTPQKLSEIDPEIAAHLALIVLDDPTTNQLFNKSVPSTILDCTHEKIRLLRAGAIPTAKIEAIIGQPLDTISSS